MLPVARIVMQRFGRAARPVADNCLAPGKRIDSA
jgi:hypothetical protein